MYYIFWVFVCSLRYPARNAHAPYCHLWPIRLCNIFPYYLINCTIFEKKLSNTKGVFWFSYNIFGNISHSKSKWARYDQNRVLIFMYSTRFSCQIVINLDFYLIVSRKILNINFHDNPSNRRRVVPCGQTDEQRHGEADGHVSKFCKRI